MGNLHYLRLLVLSLLLIILEHTVRVSAVHTSFCIRLPQDKTLKGSYAHSGDENVNSVGIEKFPQDIWGKYALSMDRDDPTTGTSTDGLKDLKLLKTINFVGEQDAFIHLSLKTIKGRLVGDDPLTGWFQVTVKSNLDEGFSTYLQSFILFATDEQGNSVGTFEHDPFPNGEGDCRPSSATRHMIIPCGGVSVYEPIASNVVLFASNKTANWPTNYKSSWPIVPDYWGDSKGADESAYALVFYFRFSLQAVNKNGAYTHYNDYVGHRIIFRLIGNVDPSKYGPNDLTQHTRSVLSNYLVTANAHFTIRKGAIPGAADPLSTDRTTLSCEGSVTDFIGIASNEEQQKGFYERGGGYIPKNYHWYFEKYRQNLVEEGKRYQLQWSPGYFIIVGWTINTKTGCTAKFYGGRCDSTFCRKSNEGLGTSDPATKRFMADSHRIPQVRSKKTDAVCSCKSTPAHSICFPEAIEKPTLFNNEPAEFKDCFTLYKELASKGAICDKKKVDVQSQKIKVIRRNSSVTEITYVSGGNNNIYNYTSKKEFDDRKQAIDQRGVRIFGSGTILYGVRKGHGIIMLLMSFFCVPVSIFVSRYYKESFMARRILYSRVWFQIHIQLVIWMATFFISGLMLALVGRGFLGVSLHPYGLMHRIFGWVTFGVFIIIASTGGIRWYNDTGRRNTILIHWILGYLFYVLNVLSVISSIHVPGSPVAQHDKSINEKDAKETAGNYIYIVITFWILFELVVNVSMNFLLHAYDRWMDIQEPRIYIPPYIGVPIPVLKENTIYNASGSGIRLMTFWIYIGVAALMALLTSGICILGDPSLYKGFGPMSCTHEYNASLDTAKYHSLKYQFRKTVDPSCFYKQ